MAHALGHRAVVKRRYGDEPFDLLIVLHAKKGATAARRFRTAFPGRRLFVALTGTDVYGNLTDSSVRATLESADRLIALQPATLKRLKSQLRSKTVVIPQSATPV